MPATFQKTIAADGDYKIASASDFASVNGFSDASNNSSNVASFSGTISVVQEGTASWSLYYSPDLGDTLIPLKDQSGTQVTGTASDGINFTLGKGSNTEPVELYIRIAGASGLTMETIVQSN